MREVKTAARENTIDRTKKICELGLLVTALASSCTVSLPRGDHVRADVAFVERWRQQLNAQSAATAEKKQEIVIEEERDFHGPHYMEKGAIFFEESIGERVFPKERHSENDTLYLSITATSTSPQEQEYKIRGEKQNNGEKSASLITNPLFLDNERYALYGIERRMLPRERWEDPEKNFILYGEQRSPLTERERRSGAFIEDYNLPSTAVRVVGRAVKKWMWERDVGVIRLAKTGEEKAHEALDYFNPLTLLPIQGGTSVDPYIKENSLGIRFKRGVVSLNIGTNLDQNDWSVGFYVEQ